MARWALLMCKLFYDAGKKLSSLAAVKCTTVFQRLAVRRPTTVLSCRPCSKQEVASRTPQIIQVVEANKEVVLMQSVAGKHMGRAFHYDKVHSFPAIPVLCSNS